MSAETIQAQYEQLQTVAATFGKQADAQAALRKAVQARVEPLRAGGWQGRGAAQFLAEMDGKVSPALDRLTAALREAQKVTREIATLMRAAEEDAARPFHGGAQTGADRANEHGETPLPDMPAAPAQSGAGDGSGQHGAAGPATDADRKTYDTMSAAALLARLRGYDVTADHMAHYLGNSGEPLTVDVDRMMREMPEFRRAAEQQFRQEVWSAAQQQIAANYQGEPLEFPITTDWRSDYYPGREQYPNWYYGVGGFSYSQTAIVTVTPDPNGGPPDVVIRSQVHMFDRYNWDAGKSVTIPSSGNEWIDDHTIAGDYIPDTAMGRLHQTGIAQEYEMSGHGDPQITRYTYDPDGGALQESPPDAGAGR